MQILYKYERNWSKAAQNNWLWVLLKLAYTQISLQYFGASLLSEHTGVFIVPAPCFCGACLGTRLVVTDVGTNVYAGAAFMTLFWKESFAAWRSMHFLGHFMVAAVLLGAHAVLYAHPAAVAVH